MAIPQELIDLFNKDFGKTKKPKAAVAEKPKRKEPFTEALKEMHLSTSRQWVPVAFVYHVTEQHCKCCGSTVELTGKVLTRHVSESQHAVWETHRTTLQEGLQLPRELVVHREEVEHCPPCLRAEMVVCSFPNDKPRQLSFLHS